MKARDLQRLITICSIYEIENIGDLYKSQDIIEVYMDEAKSIIEKYELLSLIRNDKIEKLIE